MPGTPSFGSNEPRVRGVTLPKPPAGHFLQNRANARNGGHRPQPLKQRSAPAPTFPRGEPIPAPRQWRFTATPLTFREGAQTPTTSALPSGAHPPVAPPFPRGPWRVTAKDEVSAAILAANPRASSFDSHR